MGFQRDSQYVQLFNYYLNIIYQEGISDKIFAMYESSGQVCPDLNGLPLGMNSCITGSVYLKLSVVVPSMHKVYFQF